VTQAECVNVTCIRNIRTGFQCKILKEKKTYGGPTYRYSGDNNMGLKQTRRD